MLNAAEATQSKTERRVTVSTAQGDGVVRLQVSDNGEGIPPENLAKIFDPFFTTKPEGKGVGLGLAVSYGIIEAHGGEIEVKSTWARAPRSRCRCRLPPRSDRDCRRVLARRE